MLSTLYFHCIELGCSSDFGIKGVAAMMDHSSHDLPSNYAVELMGKITDSPLSSSNSTDGQHNYHHNLASSANVACHTKSPTTEKTMDPSEASGYIASEKLNARPRGALHHAGSSSTSGDVPDKAASSSSALIPPAKKRRIRRRGAGSSMSKDSQRQMLRELGPYDILCGRSSMAYNNIGNRRFRVTINLNLDRYIAAPTRHAKSHVIRELSSMLLNDVGARFLKVREKPPSPGSTNKAAKGKSGGGKGEKKPAKKEYEFIELDEKDVHNKVSHALRDLVMSQRNSQQALMMVSMPPGFLGGSGGDGSSSFPFDDDNYNTSRSRNTATSSNDPLEAMVVSSSRQTSTSMEEDTNATTKDNYRGRNGDGDDEEDEDDDRSALSWPDPLPFRSK